MSIFQLQLAKKFANNPPPTLHNVKLSFFGGFPKLNHHWKVIVFSSNRNSGLDQNWSKPKIFFQDFFSGFGALNSILGNYEKSRKKFTKYYFFHAFSGWSKMGQTQGFYYCSYPTWTLKIHLQKPISLLLWLLQVIAIYDCLMFEFQQIGSIILDKNRFPLGI